MIGFALFLALASPPHARAEENSCSPPPATAYGVELAGADEIVHVMETVEVDDEMEPVPGVTGATGPVKMRKAPIRCLPCADEDVTEVDLRLQGTVENESTGFEAGESATFDSNHPSGAVGLQARLSHPGQVASLLRQFSRSCVRVRQLTFVAHGNEGGLVWLDEATLQGANLAEAFPDGADCVFQSGAKIDIESCLSGYGCDGTMFLADMARRTLTKGGTVSGNTSLGLTLRFLPIPMFPLNGESQTLTLDGDGKIVSATSETCRLEIDSKLRELALTRGRMKSCILPDEAKADWRILRESGAALFEIRGADLAAHADILNSWGGRTTNGLFDYETAMARFEYSLGDVNAALDAACPR